MSWNAVLQRCGTRTEQNAMKPTARIAHTLGESGAMDLAPGIERRVVFNAVSVIEANVRVAGTDIKESDAKTPIHIRSLNILLELHRKVTQSER